MPLVTADSVSSILDNLIHQSKTDKLPTDKVMDILVKIGQQWLNPNYSYRQEAEKYLLSITGYSKEMIREALDITFREFTEEKLTKVIESKPSSQRPVGLVTHVLAGNIFTSGLYGIVYGLLAQTPQLIKTSSKEPLFTFLFAESLKEISPVLSNNLFVCTWKGGDSAIEEIIKGQSKLVIAYGNDETIQRISSKVHSPTRFLGFGHKISFGIIGKECLTKDNIDGLAEKAAYDVAMYDQQGCLSPHFFYIEMGGNITPNEFAKIVAEKMKNINQRLPRGKISLHESSAIVQQRGVYEFRKIRFPNISVYSSTLSTDWTVVYTNESKLNISCLNRFIFIKPFANMESLMQSVQPIQGKIQCIGLGVCKDKKNIFKNALDNLHVHRYCDVGNMQKPSIDEWHKGKPNYVDFLE